MLRRVVCVNCNDAGILPEIQKEEEEKQKVLEVFWSNLLLWRAFNNNCEKPNLQRKSNFAHDCIHNTPNCNYKKRNRKSIFGGQYWRLVKLQKWNLKWKNNTMCCCLNLIKLWPFNNTEHMFRNRRGLCIAHRCWVYETDKRGKLDQGAVCLWQTGRISRDMDERGQARIAHGDDDNEAACFYFICWHWKLLCTLIQINVPLFL